MQFLQKQGETQMQWVNSRNHAFIHTAPEIAMRCQICHLADRLRAAAVKSVSFLFHMCHQKSKIMCIDQNVDQIANFLNWNLILGANGICTSPAFTSFTHFDPIIARFQATAA